MAFNKLFNRTGGLTREGGLIELLQYSLKSPEFLIRELATTLNLTNYKHPHEMGHLLDQLPWKIQIIKPTVAILRDMVLTLGLYQGQIQS